MVDEFRSALEVATEEELQQLTNILFCRRLNPIDYLQTPAPIDVQSQDLPSWLDTIEQRFRFLAADGMTVLKRRTHQVSYREILVQVCRYLKIPYDLSMATVDIEAEIFLHLLQKAWAKLPTDEQNSIRNQVIKSLANSTTPEPYL